jgi:hypothetical protein
MYEVIFRNHFTPETAVRLTTLLAIILVVGARPSHWNRTRSGHAGGISGGALVAQQEGDLKDGVLKVNNPARRPSRDHRRPAGADGVSDSADGSPSRKGDAGMHVMMGDLVLTEDEVNPVMSALLQNGIDVTALHNHFFHEQPRVFYMHVHAMGILPISPGA